jgi:hypothetical protein
MPAMVVLPCESIDHVTVRVRGEKTVAAFRSGSAMITKTRNAPTHKPPMAIGIHIVRLMFMTCAAA